MRKKVFKLFKETEGLLTLDEVLDFACIGVNTLEPNLTPSELLFLESLPSSISLEEIKSSSIDTVYRYYEESFLC